MKIGLVQLNLIIGDITYNCNKIIHNIQKAKSMRVDLLVFSELTICGYPPRDLLEKTEFLEKIENGIQAISLHTKNIAVILGAPTINLKPTGKRLYNSALFIYQKKVQFFQHKTLLPSYDVFDEDRYFQPNVKFELLQFKNEKIAITICEDIWEGQDTSFWNVPKYSLSPITELMKLKPTMLINLSASPFSYNKSQTRHNILSSIAKKNNILTIYVSQIGGYTDLIFDGDSKAFSPKGELICHLPLFKEDFRILDTTKTHKKIDNICDKSPISKIHSALVLGIKDYFKKTGFSKATIGLSGGIDSAVTATLAAKALGNTKLTGLLLPSTFSSKHSVDDAISLAEKLKIKYHKINIHTIFKETQNSLAFLFKNSSFDITEENLQARIRGILLMGFANKFKHLLLNTSNKSEIAVGYGTLYGDMCGSLSILGDMYKTQVYELAHFINQNEILIPANSINKPPSAELKPNQLDTNTLPDYDTLDKILYQYIELNQEAHKIISSGFEENTVQKIILMVQGSEYKRYQAPPILRISNKAFGIGRQIPIDGVY